MCANTRCGRWRLTDWCASCPDGDIPGLSVRHSCAKSLCFGGVRCGVLWYETAGQGVSGAAELSLVLRSGRRGRRFKSGHPDRETAGHRASRDLLSVLRVLRCPILGAYWERTLVIGAVLEPVACRATTQWPKALGQLSLETVPRDRREDIPRACDRAAAASCCYARDATPVTRATQDAMS